MSEAEEKRNKERREKQERETYEPSMILKVLYVKGEGGSQQIYKCTVPSFLKSSNLISDT